MKLSHLVLCLSLGLLPSALLAAEDFDAAETTSGEGEETVVCEPKESAGDQPSASEAIRDSASAKEAIHSCELAFDDDEPVFDAKDRRRKMMRQQCCMKHGSKYVKVQIKIPSNKAQARQQHRAKKAFLQAGYSIEIPNSILDEQQ